MYQTQILNRPNKSLVAMFYNSAFTGGSTELRLNFKILLLKICQTTLNYEHVY